MSTQAMDRPTDIITDSHLTGPFAPVVDEVDVAGLEVLGELAADLAGAYLRNGPHPRFAPIGSYVYPLDGDGMMHRVTIEGGQARYDNKFVRTAMVVEEERAGHALWGGLMSPTRPGADEVGPRWPERSAARPTSTWSTTAATCSPWPSASPRTTSTTGSTR